MNKFRANLTASNKAIKDSRAIIIEEDAIAEQSSLIIELETKLRDLKRTKLNLEDLSPDNMMSLQPAKGDFDAKKWVRQMQELKLSILETSLELECARETMEEYFTNLPEKAQPKAKK